MNPITVPAALLATGYAAPGVCVRHGEPAVFRRPFGRYLVKNWPFCARCRTRRWTLMALAVAAAFVPFIVGFGLTLALATDDAEVEAFLRATVFAVMIGALVAVAIGLMNTYSALARGKVTPDRQWVVFQGAHPTFAAEMTRILQAAHRPDPAPPTT